MDIPEEEVLVILNESKVNPLNIKANLDWKIETLYKDLKVLTSI